VFLGDAQQRLAGHRRTSTSARPAIEPSQQRNEARLALLQAIGAPISSIEGEQIEAPQMQAAFVGSAPVLVAVKTGRPESTGDAGDDLRN
jgi:hypothetical protein